jgi:hypothetical protein
MSRAFGFGAIVTAALVLSAAPAAAQTVDDIVARHIAARGGYERLKAIQTIRITRTVATPFNDVKIVIYKKRPHLYRADHTPSGQPPVTRVLNLDSLSETVGGKTGVRGPQAFAEARDLEADFEGLLVDWKAKGHTVTLEGKEALTGGDAYKLKLTTKSGVVRNIYLDAKTYLDRRHTGLFTIYHPTNRERDRVFTIVVDFGNWREVEGVKFPFDIQEERTSKEPVQTLVTYTEKIEVNVPVDDSLFATPGR